MGTPETCPCGAGEYADCCGPFHQGALAPTAEAMMRSRYSAFALRRADYLEHTHDPSTLAPNTYQDLDDTKWVGLTILDTTGGAALNITGTVTFAARFIQKARLGCLSERSDFRREAGRWLYTKGTHRPTASPAKVGRNHPCPCGASRKFKLCCGRP